MFGYQQSDNRTETEAIKNLNNSLSTTNTSFVEDNNSDIGTTTSGTVQGVLDNTSDKLCPGITQCSGNGNCINAKCICDQGIVHTDL